MLGFIFLPFFFIALIIVVLWGKPFVDWIAVLVFYLVLFVDFLCDLAQKQHEQKSHSESPLTKP